MLHRTVVRHSKNGDLGDGAIPSFYTTSTLINGRQIRVHVTGVTTATGHFFTCSGNLTKGVAVGRKISENDQDVLFKLVCVVFGSCEGKTRSNDTFDAVLY
jgi:hypothetical protein